MRTIVQKGDPVLRKKAKEVSLKQFGSKELLSIISDMKKALESQDDGVAIAAPQIGIPLRIFVIAKRVFELLSELKHKNVGSDKISSTQSENNQVVYINPEITKSSRKKKLVDEGCLSVRNYYGKVSRSEKTTVEAYDERGRKFVRGGADLLAQIFQHEIDHLNGVLFIDKTRDLYYLPATDSKHKPKSNDKP